MGSWEDDEAVDAYGRERGIGGQMGGRKWRMREVEKWDGFKVELPSSLNFSILERVPLLRAVYKVRHARGGRGSEKV